MKKSVNGVIVDMTPEEIEARKAEEVEYEKVKIENDKVRYRFERATKYPAIGDQLDALYHAGAFPEDMAKQIKEVKDKYPKT